MQGGSGEKIYQMFFTELIARNMTKLCKDTVLGRPLTANVWIVCAGNKQRLKDVILLLARCGHIDLTRLNLVRQHSLRAIAGK